MNKRFVVYSLLSSMMIFGACTSQKKIEFRTAPVERGDLAIQISASGTINPSTIVAVGTQVSGTIARLYADFNTPVKKGQIIAELDTIILHVAVEDAGATLQKARAQQTLAEVTIKRSQSLVEKGLGAQSDLDNATAQLAATKAEVSSAQAVLERAEINRSYATIRSPISGVVVNRAVDVGQTVAASFNTPTLFSIANDLTHMQVLATIDEADIGMVKLGQAATFTVDAFPSKFFTGTVNQIRLQPTTLQNVVTYTVVIDVENRDLLLMPGMTATITITVASATNVLKVPRSALQFVPERDSTKKGSGRREYATKSGDTASGAHKVQRGKFGNGNSRPPRVFVLGPDGKPKRVPIDTGLSNGSTVSITGDALAEGQEVIVGLVENTKKSPSQQGGMSPLGGMPRMR